MSQNQLIVALDVEDLAAANELVTTLSDDVKWFKIGKQLFTSAGPTSVKLLHELNKNIFLDLKFHDIPNTVAGAVGSATKIGANMINIHASGGLEMMRAAAEVAEKQASELGIPKPALLGVTILTSVNETNFQRDFGTQRKLKDQVAYPAELSQRAGLDGVVASPLEIGLIRKVCGERLCDCYTGCSSGVGGFKRSAAGHDTRRSSWCRSGLHCCWTTHHRSG